jgi:titin
MSSPLITRARATSLAAVLVALALCLGVSGLTALSASAAVTAAPSAPTNLFASNDSGVSVVVYWDPTIAGDGSDDADTFTVTLDDGIPADFKSISVLGDSPDGPMTVFSSVHPGSYSVTVTAVNTFGSATSDPLLFDMAANTSVPSAPLNVVAHNAGDGIVRITWDAPVSEGHSPVIEYLASITFPDSVDPSYGGPYGFWNGQIIGASDREFTFRELPFNHGDFVVTVNAINEDATNEPQYGYETSTAPAPLVRSTVPSAPTQVSAASTAANTVTISWGAPSTDGGFPVSDYVITMAPDFGTYTSADDRTTIFSGVPAGSHTVVVTAYNVNGQSVTATAPVTVRGPALVTPPGVVTPPAAVMPVVRQPASAPVVVKAPSPPRNVSVVTRHGGRAVVTFTTPRYLHHGAITGYSVMVAGQRKHVDANQHTVSFRGLTKGTYKTRVYARNKAGRSVAGAAKVVMSPSKAAAKPITLKLGMLGWSVRQLRLAVMPNQQSGGEFDAATRTAVITWQRNHHDALTGVVNARMRAALNI